MKCMLCKGTLEKRTVPYHIDRNGYHLTLDSVPANVCVQCGEAYFEEREVNEIQKALRSLDKRAVKIPSAA